MRVLFVASEPVGTATYRYRSENLARCLRQTGHVADAVYVGDSRVVVDADVVVLHRICDVPEGVAFARAARKIGATLVYSADDSVFDADSFPETGEPWEVIRSFAPRHAAMIAESDAVLCSTDYLADEIRRIFGAEKPTFVVRNFLSEELLHRSEAAGRDRETRGDNAVTFGYFSGSSTHNGDFAVIAPALYDLLLERENTRLLVAGTVLLDTRIEQMASVGKLVRVPFTDWRGLPERIARADINLSPLNLRHRFVRGKSEIKFLEAAAVGVPTVATQTEGFVESVPPNVISYCADNRDWYANLLALLDADKRRDLAERAYAHTLMHGTESAQTPHVVSTFESFAALRGGGQSDTPGKKNTVRVNYPFAPVKYLAKALLRRSP